MSGHAISETAASEGLEAAAFAAAEPAAEPAAESASAAQEPASAPQEPARGETIRKRLKKSDVIKFIGLLIFFVLCGVVVKFLWPYIGGLFEEGGVQTLVAKVQEAGAGGIFVMLGVQLLQIIVAFIPGEVVQVAAGLVYGTWGGFALLVVGCIISSALVFVLVKALGAPFVQEMVSTKYLEKFRAFEASGKLDLVVFILFLIPGLPKDVFTYLVPLTDMRLGRFLVLATLGRLPGMLVTTFAASSITRGDYLTAIIVFAAGALIATLGIVFKDKILAFFSNKIAARKNTK